MAIGRLLIANRGEIARRIIRTCKRLGIETVAVCAPSEFYSPYALEADFRHEFPVEDLADTFLSVEAVLGVAKLFRVDAIHPGYGFLSENAGFAEQTEGAGFIFIGPAPHVIRQLGEKHRGIELARSLNIPTVPGVKDTEQQKLTPKEISGIGFPLMIKAAFGGGGRGMRLVTESSQLETAIKSSRRESLAAFGRDDIICERYIAPSRHIEVQLIGDKVGNLIHLFERDCSLQRRYQKVIEEAPAPGLTSNLRRKIIDSALELGGVAKLDNAATVEFILASDENGQATGEYFFMEVNPRLQVEHTVTEEITGLDIVELQLIAASGQPLIVKQSDIRVNGHSIQARVCAENSINDFAPSFGSVVNLTLPSDPGIRVESSLAIGSELSGRYDSMLLKLIAHDRERSQAAARISRALDETSILGISNNLNFLSRSLETEFFSGNQVYPNSTTFSQLQQKLCPDFELLALAVVSFAAAEIDAFLRTAARLSRELVGFRADSPPIEESSSQLIFSSDLPMRRFLLKFDALDNDLPFQAQLKNIQGSLSSGTVVVNLQLQDEDPRSHSLSWDIQNGMKITFNSTNFRIGTRIDWCCVLLSINSIFAELHEQPLWTRPTTEHQGELTEHIIIAPLPGRILEIKTGTGATVKKGDPLIVLESMKTEHFIYADREGAIKSIHSTVGALVKAKEPLITLI